MTATLDTIKQIVSDIHCSDYEIFVGSMGDGFYLQVCSVCVNNDTGDPYFAKGRKWYISSHSTRGEVVQTALLAVLKFSEHEIREQFTYKGMSLFNGHISIDALLEASLEREVRTTVIGDN